MPTSPPNAPAACRDHPERPAAARCASCNRPLCDDCYRFRLSARPACARCAYEASTRRSRRVSLAISFLSISLGGGFWAARRFNLWDREPVVLVLGALAAVIVAVIIGVSGRDLQQPSLENRDPEQDPADEGALSGGKSPYRAHARRALLAASPRVSGSTTAILVIVSLAASAVLLPASLKLPRWIEVELVLGLWWLIVAIALIVLLYRGFRLRDDFVYFAPWNRPDPPSQRPVLLGESNKSTPRWADGCSGIDGCSGVDAEGCAGAVVVAIALALAFGAAWVVVELAMPVVFLLMYWLFMRALGRVANDRHGCEKDAAKSIGWGALWATIYVAPIAALTWAVHAFLR